jgi:hypothetical protein
VIGMCLYRKREIGDPHREAYELTPKWRGNNSRDRCCNLQ